MQYIVRKIGITKKPKGIAFLFAAVILTVAAIILFAFSSRIDSVDLP